MLSKPLPAYSSGTADKPLLGQTLGANFERSVARFGDREALVDVATNRRWTYNELDVEIDEAALGLLELGIGKGDRVGIWALNCAEWVIIQYATAKIGAILVNVNPAYRAHELRYVIEQSGMRLLVSATVYRSSDYRAMVEQVRPDCPGLTEVVYIGEDSWDQLMARGSRADHQRLEAQAATLSFDDAINISTPAARPASRRAPRCRTTTSSTTATSSRPESVSPRRTGSPSPFRCTTASAWSWG